LLKKEGVLKVTGSHILFKSGSVFKKVLDKYVKTTVHTQTGSDMPYGHLIAATVMTLGVCQGHSSIASFFFYTDIAELLVLNHHGRRALC